MEWHFQNDYVSTYAFHEHRERAPHLEQDAHRHRLLAAFELIKSLPDWNEPQQYWVSDLGCGDGGLLQLLKGEKTQVWGYDFCPANRDGWKDRGVEDVTTFKDWTTHDITLGDVVVLTEVLEHLRDPHAELRWLYGAKQHGSPAVDYIVASSPWHEDNLHHAAEHNWAWDMEGYEKLFTSTGWKIRSHTQSEWSQLIVAER